MPLPAARWCSQARRPARVGPEVRFSYEQWHTFSAPLEGRVPFMYCDVLGLITTGVGNLINTPAQAEALHWLLADGTPAPLEAVRADWHKLHDNAQHYAKLAWFRYSAELRCHLSDAAIDALVQRTLAANEAILRKHFALWDTYPADAQIAIMSQAWAVGAAFWGKFPALARCIEAQDWEGCAAACTIREAGNPGVVPRNARDRFCFHNAALVKAEDLDPSILFWPAAVPSVNDHAANEAARNAAIHLAAWQALENCPYAPESSGLAALESST